MAHHGDHDAHEPSHYIKIWGILLVLLIISFIGPFVGEATGIVWITLTTAFGIAVVKAYLVMKHFMHLDVEKPIVWYMLITGVAFMVLLFGGTAADVKNHEGSRWQNVAAKAAVERGVPEVGHHDDGGHDDDAHDDGHH